MYHLFDAYHLGTNRGVFFIQPRPHTLEEPSGFVRGPRPVEGIQEIFIVVNRPKEGPDYCVSVRLDTAHFVEVPVMDYEWRDEEVELSAAAPPPGFGDPGSRPDEPLSLPNKIGGWRTLYDCFAKDDKKSHDYVPPGPDFIIDVGKNGGFTVIFEEVNPPAQGKNIHVVEDGILMLRSEATSHACYISMEQRADHVDRDLPNPTSNYAASAKQRVRVHLRSQTPRREVGKRRELMVTTRGLCCCGSKLVFVNPRPEGLASVIPLGPTMSSTTYLVQAQGSKDEAAAVPGREIHTNVSAQREGLMTIREANELSDTIRNAMHQSVAQRINGERIVSLVDTDLFGDLIHAALLKSRSGGSNLSEPICECLPEDLLARLRDTLGPVADTLTRHDIVALDGSSLADVTGLEPDAARRLRLELLGIPLVKPPACDSAY